MKSIRTPAAAVVLAALSVSAIAEIKVGVITAATGPGASLGIPYKNTFAALPATLGGEPVTYIVLDDATDPANATRLARKLVTEDKVDLIIGSGNVPTAAAISTPTARSASGEV